MVVVGLFGGDITISTPFIPMKAMTSAGVVMGSPKELKELLALVRKTRAPAVPIQKAAVSEANAGLMDLEGRQGGRPLGADAGRIAPI